MKTVAIVGLVLTILLLGSAVPSDAYWAHGGHGHFHGGVFIGAPLWWGPGWWGPGWWGPGYGYYGPPAAVQQEAPVYLQPEPQPSYWYYCQNPQGYYPYIQQCPGGWLQVVPQQQAPPAR